MTLIEILKSHDLTDEQISAIQNDMKVNKVFTSGEENLDIRYQKLKEDHESLKTQFDESSKLIESLKDDTKNSETLQSKIVEYETTVATLQNQLEEQKKESAVKLALMNARASDIDYMMYKMKDEVKLDEDGKIVGIDDIITGLKTRYPQHFEAGSQKFVDAQRLEDSTNNDTSVRPTNLAEALRQQYENN